MSDLTLDTALDDPLLGALASAPAVPVSHVGRFRLVRPLGEGTFGAVYEAEDPRDGARIALKRLRSARADWLLRFKREFRLLSGVVHPNLVRLDELGTDGEHWYFTMELVNGEPFDAFVRRAPSQRAAAFAGLVRGLGAIHASGRLHRDVKPSNVVVEPGGRVVLLDFGLALELDAHESTQVAGTPHFMAPEQYVPGPLTAACDLYAVGVMLYEALTGVSPFAAAHGDEIAANKRAGFFPGPRALDPSLPPELAELCCALLSPEPSARPSARRTLEVLEQEIRQPAELESGRRDELFVGREQELARLRRAFDSLEAWQPAVALVVGSSGMGKTALVDRFLRELARERPDVLVLRGRCWAEESLPYKALDAVVDQLSRHLAHASPAEVRAVLPRHARALERLFPVLHQVEAIRNAPVRGRQPTRDEERNQAMSALRELVTRIALQRPVVLAVDDLHWGDADSAALLGEILRPPDAPPLLFVGAYRGEEASTSPLLVKLFELHKGVLASIAWSTVALGALTGDEADALVRGLVGDAVPEGDFVAHILGEARGCPFFVHELVRGASGDPLPTLDRALRGRLARLSMPAHRLLESIAVAARPLSLAVCRAAHPEDDLRGALAVLRTERLVRVRELDGGDEDVVESYHDRIREGVLRATPPDGVRAAHRRLARALEAVNVREPEHLGQHLAAAGELERAAEVLREGARRAAAAHAFDHAARLLSRVLELEVRRGIEGEHLRALRRELGDVLAEAGRGGESANAYLLAAQGAPRDEAFELERRAGEQLFIAGHMERGREVMAALFARRGLVMPAGGLSTWAALVPRRARLALRGYRVAERSTRTVSSEALGTVDLLASGVVGLLSDNPPAASLVVSELVPRALGTGDPERALVALTLEVITESLMGQSTRRVQASLDALVARLGTPRAACFGLGARALRACFAGSWRRVLTLLEQIDALDVQRIGRLPPWWSRLLLTRFDALYWMGQVDEAARALPPVLRDLSERGQHFGEVWMSFIWSWVLCAHDRPSEARQVIAHALHVWGRGGLVPRIWHTNNQLALALYERRGALALRLAEDSPLRPHMLPFIGRMARVQHRFNHARANIAWAAEARGKRDGLLARAEGHVRSMAGEGIPWASAVAAALAACIAWSRGDETRASRELAAAERRLLAVDMGAAVMAARHLRARLVGGDEGRALKESTERWARENGVVDLTRFSAMYLPAPR